MADGSPITDYNFRPSVTTITYTLAYEEQQARIYAGMSINEYEALPGTPMWIKPNIGGYSKSHIVVLYRLSNTIPAVAQDASAREMERKVRRH